MFITNFTYDGATLTSKGYMVCDFGSGDNNGMGSELTFTTVPINKGVKFLMADAKYDQYLTTTIQICKSPCNHDKQEDLIITPSEISTLSRWLNKKSFRPLTFDSTDWSGIRFEATFNIKTINIGGDCYGLELEMITNRPFAVKTAVTQTMAFVDGALTQSFNDTSDEIGYIYPTTMTITMGATAGNLSISNSQESNRSTVIKNCQAGEVITIAYPTISTNSNSHAIVDDFNYVFPRVANSSSIVANVFTVNLPCTIVLTYDPIVKIAL